jgi:hypothetical protein
MPSAVGGLLVVGLAVGPAPDLHVEHVHLAVDGLHLSVGADVHAGVRALLPALDTLGDRAGDEVDAQLGGRRARPPQGRAVERLGTRRGLLRRAQHGPLLGEHDELRTGGGGRSSEPVGGGEVALAIGGTGELDGGGDHGLHFSLPGD